MFAVPKLLVLLYIMFGGREMEVALKEFTLVTDNRVGKR